MQAIPGPGDPVESPDLFSGSGCLLCDEVTNNGALSMRLGLYGRPGARILLETPDFLLIPDISPVVPGHSLLITRIHVSCFADLPSAMRRDLQTTLERAVALVRASHGESLLFEHGSATPHARTGACVNHAHIHLLPTHTPAHHAMSQFGGVTAIDAALPSHGLGCGRGRNYLWCRSPAGGGYVLANLERDVPCQFIRRVVARYHGVEDWQWEAVLKGTHRASNAK